MLLFISLLVAISTSPLATFLVCEIEVSIETACMPSAFAATGGVSAPAGASLHWVGGADASDL